ncbi:MAG: hypothetical protein JXR49_06350 [Acidobacteria bacterium]|nr:hypothetical protein [Acidobacteriota bacterium]
MLMAATPVLLATLSGVGLNAQEQVVPVVDGHLGRCTADFTVTDEDRNPLYDAKIDVYIRYGFLGLRKMSLQVGTNSDGRARVAGLPDKADKKFSFKITSGTLSDAVLMNTSDGCNAVFEVTLKEE